MQAPQNCLVQPADQCRAAIFESLGHIRLFAEAAQLHLEAGDDHGARYSVGKMIAHVKVAARTADDLEAIHSGGGGK